MYSTSSLFKFFFSFKVFVISFILLFLNSPSQAADQEFVFYEEIKNKEPSKRLALTIEGKGIRGLLPIALLKKVEGYLIKHKFLKSADNEDILRHGADSQARYYYCLAAFQNHKKAALALASFYRENWLKVGGFTLYKGEKAQLKEAAKFYKIAAQAGNVSAAESLKQVLQDLQSQ